MNRELNRRLLLAASAGLAGCASLPGSTQSGKDPAFVTRDGTSLSLDGKPYRFAGANIWYAAWLGADAAFGDRARLRRELDRLKAMGVTNLRLLGAAEEGPLKNSIRPGFRNTSGELNQTLAVGLDYAMAEIARREMKAVIYLTNFWEWSGGMMALLHRTTGSYIDNGDPAHPWPAFADRSSAFYSDSRAVGMFRDHLRAIVSRTNSITGIAYAADPALMAWQLCNEPRPGGSDAIIEANLPAYYRWIKESAALIRALDRNHLVSLGQEGTIAANMREDVVIEAHSEIDYLTAHIWPLNWGWVDGKNLAGTWDAGRQKVQAYLDTHIRIAARQNKPLLIEEFGFPRDGEYYAPEATTRFREQYYALIYAAAEKSLAENGPVAGTNFWAWNGEARARHADHRFRNGDGAYMGDPPHEPQGWYGLFDSDAAMIELVRDHAARFSTG